MSRAGQYWISSLLILAIVVVEMATDIYIPTLSYLTQVFKTTEEAVNTSLSACLLGLSLAGPVFGSLSDSFGRKKPVILGLLIFALSSFGCSFSSTVEELIVWRFFQGVGGAAPAVLGWAILKDLYEGKEAARAMTTVGMAMTVSPAVAPLLGGYIASHYDWTWIFVIIGVVGSLTVILSLRSLPETLHKDDRVAFSLRERFENYFQILIAPRYLLPALMASLTYGSLWAYFAATTFFFVRQLGYTMIEYALFDAALILFYILGSLVTRQLLKKRPIQSVLKKGIYAVCLGGFCLLLITTFFPNNAFFITGAMAIHSFGMAMLFPNAAALALDSFPDTLGSGSALLSTLECLTAGIMVILAGYLYVTHLIWVAVMILAVSLITYYIYEKYSALADKG